ncbi:hypothetical protein [Enhygromyxa salina]|uniref:hypothetical protein n=1 Tax=Enhygromyxa salina TaxID=215803 RepID=UPI002158C202|nr:hypothetical protein [Enhygromyxa salina]
MPNLGRCDDGGVEHHRVIEIAAQQTYVGEPLRGDGATFGIPAALERALEVPACALEIVDRKSIAPGLRVESRELVRGLSRGFVIERMLAVVGDLRDRGVVLAHVRSGPGVGCTPLVRVDGLEHDLADRVMGEAVAASAAREDPAPNELLQRRLERLPVQRTELVHGRELELDAHDRQRHCDIADLVARADEAKPEQIRDAPVAAKLVGLQRSRAPCFVVDVANEQPLVDPRTEVGPNSEREPAADTMKRLGDRSEFDDRARQGRRQQMLNLCGSERLEREQVRLELRLQGPISIGALASEHQRMVRWLSLRQDLQDTERARVCLFEVVEHEHQRATLRPN